MLDTTERAWTLSPKVVEHHETDILAWYRPNGRALPEATVQAVVKQMKHTPP